MAKQKRVTYSEFAPAHERALKLKNAGARIVSLEPNYGRHTGWKREWWLVYRED